LQKGAWVQAKGAAADWVRWGQRGGPGGLGRSAKKKGRAISREAAQGKWIGKKNKREKKTKNGATRVGGKQIGASRPWVGPFWWFVPARAFK